MLFLLEVIEHLGLEEGRETVRNIYRILNRGGRIILTTPNTYTPGQYWRDITHLTPYHCEELGALFLSEKYEIVEICRILREPLLKFYLKGYILSPFNEY